MSSGSTNNGIGFFGLLAIVFITLKLTNFIDWTWWQVTAPLWAPLLLILAIAFIGCVSLVVLKALKYGRT